MANILFRMANSFFGESTGQSPARQAGQFIARGNVPRIHGLIRGISGELLWRLEPVEVAGRRLLWNRASG
jgi:hypothetical protein